MSEPRQYVISPSQGVRLMALATMLRDGDLAFRGDERDDEQSAHGTVLDVAEEIAIQAGAMTR